MKRTSHLEVNERMETTKYAPIPGCSGYLACTDGYVWSLWEFKGAGYAGKCRQIIGGTRKRLKADFRKEDGRGRYTLKRDGGGYRRTYGARLVLEAFIGPCPDGMECCHRDGCCTNDRLSNLRWGTPKSSKGDMVEHGTRLQGEAINTAKITEADVIEIRRVGYPLKPLARSFWNQ